MTTEPKAKGVDVMAVMDAAAKTCKLYGHDKSANELPKARDAVAELMDKAENCRRALVNLHQARLIGDGYVQYANDLGDALKRIGGQK